MRFLARSLLVLLVFALGGIGDAQGPGDVDRFESAPLDHARLARRWGDGGVLARLAPERSVETRLEAIRATPWMRAPEAALETLVGLARGRDPTLAPAATSAVHRIVEALDRPALERREADVAALSPVGTALRALANDGTARADLRRVAAVDAALLEGL